MNASPWTNLLVTPPESSDGLDAESLRSMESSAHSAIYTLLSGLRGIGALMAYTCVDGRGGIDSDVGLSIGALQECLAQAIDDLRDIESESAHQLRKLATAEATQAAEAA